MSLHPTSGLMPVEQALDYLQAQPVAVLEDELVPLAQALGRVLAIDVFSGVMVPPADNSAVDGYVIGVSSIEANEPQWLPVSLRIPAGQVPESLDEGAAGRIFTGAQIPQGGNAVVMQEDCELKDGKVLIPAFVKGGNNVRPAGQDITLGEKVFTQGHRLQPQDLGLLASIGVGEVRVKRRLKVAVLSTGDELIEPGEADQPGKIYNSNRYTLRSLLETQSCEIIDLGIVKDDYASTLQALEFAAKNADLILSSGGVSVGEEDHVKAAISALGKLDLWRLAIKPGKPLAFGKVGDVPFIGLPGNPCAVFVTFTIIAKPFIARMQGREAAELLPFKLPATFEVKKPGLRQEYLRVRLANNQGQLVLEAYPNQSSGVLSSASWADGFAVVPKGEVVKQGELVDYLPFAKLLA